MLKTIVALLSVAMIASLEPASTDALAENAVTKESLINALRFRGAPGNEDVREQPRDEIGKPKLPEGKQEPVAENDDVRKRRELLERLGKLTRRGISGEERAELTRIVTESKLPSVDLVILFAYNSSTVTQKSLPTLMSLGNALASKEFESATFLVAGHTDATGSEAYNLKLSESRANAVKQFLVSNFGLKADKLIAVGYGEEQLKTPDQPTAAGNRRVQVTNLLN